MQQLTLFQEVYTLPKLQAVLLDCKVPVVLFVAFKTSGTCRSVGSHKPLLPAPRLRDVAEQRDQAARGDVAERTTALFRSCH